jgi:hypothetical protein
MGDICHAVGVHAVGDPEGGAEAAQSHRAGEGLYRVGPVDVPQSRVAAEPVELHPHLVGAL